MKFFALNGRLASSLPIPPDACAGRPDPFRFACIFLFGLLGLPAIATALQPAQAEAIPHVNQQAREHFVQYLHAGNHKAYAIAPGGTWAWTESELSVEEAKTSALQRCQQHTEQQCVLYSVNDEIVFDATTWPRLWRLTPAQLQQQAVGVKRGMQFPNLQFKDRHGKPSSLRKFTGKITLVHFWGSWCAPCLREMPHMLKLQKTLQQQHGNKVAMVLLQVREPFADSQAWAVKQGFDSLPLYDSGVQDSDDAELHTVEGKTYQDRELAIAFPASYVLDAKGRVLFAHRGPIADWQEYLPFFTDAVTHKRK